MATTDALGNTTATAYDPWNNVVAVTDPLGRTTQYVYNNQGEKTEQIAPDPDDYTADGGTNGLAAAPITYYGYDAAGNLAYVTDALGSGPADPAHTTWYFYDDWNRKTLVVDALANMPAPASDVPPPTQPADSTLTTFDFAGNVSTVTQAVNGTTQFQTTTFQYDYLGRKTKEIDADPNTGTQGSGSPITQFMYDLNGNVLSTIDPLGHTTWTVYDALNRAVKTVSADGSGPNDTHYATTTVYDAVGNTLSVTDPGRQRHELRLRQPQSADRDHRSVPLLPAPFSTISMATWSDDGLPTAA